MKKLILLILINNCYAQDICIVGPTPIKDKHELWAEQILVINIPTKFEKIGNKFYKELHGYIQNKAGDEIPINGSVINGYRNNLPVWKTSIIGTLQHSFGNPPGYFLMSANLEFPLTVNFSKFGIRDDLTTTIGYASIGNILVNYDNSQWDIGTWVPIWNVDCKLYL